MFDRLFYRNMRARDNLEIFLVSAVASLLLLRFVLYLSGYPQVGGHTLHIAHMLWGGLLMLTSMVLLINFLGARVQRLAALIGGIGFGIFIDELGKFITKDNNYFFRPTIGIIYAVFMVLYLIFNFVSRHSQFSSREYQFNALQQFEEAVAHDLDKYEKATIRKLLLQADKHDHVTKELLQLLKHLDTVAAPHPSWIRRQQDKISALYGKFWLQRSSSQVVSTVFVVGSLIFALGTTLNVVHNFTDLWDLLNADNSYAKHLALGQIVSAAIATVFVVVGAIRLTTNRLQGLECFRRALIINLFLTEFFIFTRIQFGAMPSFIVTLVLLVGLRFAVYQERRIVEQKLK